MIAFSLDPRDDLAGYMQPQLGGYYR